jgi:predicted ribonuclease YlaK
MTCICRICERTRQFQRFQALLPETDRAEFEAWYSKMFDELEALETDREMAEYRKSQQLERGSIA